MKPNCYSKVHLDAYYAVILLASDLDAYYTVILLASGTFR